MSSMNCFRGMVDQRKCVEPYFTSEPFLKPLIIANTAQKMKFSVKNFFGKCDLIHRKLRIWAHLLKKSSMTTRKKT